MNALLPQSTATTSKRLAVGAAAVALSACSLLQPKTSTPPSFYALQIAHLPVAQEAVHPVKRLASTLVISPVRAASGFDSQRIIYTREPHKIAYFAHSEWIDTPARMLGPLLVESIERTGAFKAVVMTQGSAGGDLRLDTEIIRLQHDFNVQPSRVRFTLRVYLVEEKSRRVLAWREFNDEAVSRHDDPYAGVVAANQVVDSVLKAAAQFVMQVAP